MSFRKDLNLELNDCIVWKDNIGYLPGSSLQFKRNSDGDILLMDGDDSNIIKKQKLVKDSIFNNGNNSQDDVAICSRCMKSDLKENLVKNNRFCRECSSIDPHVFRLYKNLSSKNVPNIQSDEEKPRTSNKLKLSNTFTIFQEFDWDTYLTKYDLEAAPLGSFLPDQLFPTTENKFKIGMKVEGVDPTVPSRFYTLTIADLQGFRLRLCFDFYSNRFDFWVNSDSKFIFPIGFCEYTGRRLEFPEILDQKVVTPEEKEAYLADAKLKAAPEECFPASQRLTPKLLEPNGFKKNAKLEAVDSGNHLICPATVLDTLNDYVLIHFDGWDDHFDFWAHVTSPLLNPVNWAKSKKKVLTIPPLHKDNNEKEFEWEDYLKKTNSEAVPESLFNFYSKKKQKPQISWKPGMRLEAVDPLNSQLIRVAHVVAKFYYGVKIRFDSFEEKFDCLYDLDSPEIHPIHWCQKTNHRLEPPPNIYVIKMITLCPVSGCDGACHYESSFTAHSKFEDCPYRYVGHPEPEQLDLYDKDSNEEEPDKHFLSSHFLDSYIRLYERISPYQLKFLKENYLEMRSYTKNLNSLYFTNIIEYFKKIDYGFQFKAINVPEFDCLKIVELIKKLTDSEKTAHIFRRENIDGVTLLSLRPEDIKIKLKIDYVPAVKIITFIFIVLKKIFSDGI